MPGLFGKLRKSYPGGSEMEAAVEVLMGTKISVQINAPGYILVERLANPAA